MLESQARISDLVERTERAEQNSLLSTQKLANTSANVEAQDKSKNEVREELQKLQISYARIEAELKHEKQRADMLQEDLLDSQKVRTSLEALCANLKSTSSHLEEKLNNQLENGSSTEKDVVEQLRKELEAKYRMELNRKLDEVNLYLEEQSRARDKLDRSRGDNENKILSDKKRLDDENTSLKLKYEQAVAARESKEIESRRYRDLYESEMRWRLRLSDQLQETTDKTLSLKSKLA
ncbi:hypothetical protein LOTGIDRAFT_176518 [Lottia gigantea]|uniref:Uncharacterized protein n=1 Tax=Lottia gigantea TaxID=225164 RepID=V4AY94_LOTGI|nr:hypothetical protein LOTGIDRAFT_176518 [Lottia gigantea]ESO98586.1 hypothetical protein LOTGIDRAFT_176518 [Lottia gigantea]